MIAALSEIGAVLVAVFSIYCVVKGVIISVGKLVLAALLGAVAYFVVPYAWTHCDFHHFWGVANLVALVVFGWGLWVAANALKYLFEALPGITPSPPFSGPGNARTAPRSTLHRSGLLGRQ